MLYSLKKIDWSPASGKDQAERRKVAKEEQKRKGKQIEGKEIKGKYSTESEGNKCETRNKKPEKKEIHEYLIQSIGNLCF